MQVHKKHFVILLVGCLSVAMGIQSCETDLVTIDNSVDMLPRLSDYNVYKAAAKDLAPSAGFHEYTISTQLFSDYAEKQRLISVPAGERLEPVGDGLPVFPNGTILVKTFYYYHDAGRPDKGRNIIETRLLIKSNNGWSAGTYLWNDEQTDAMLVNVGLNKTINWIDRQGQGKVVFYQIPSKGECSTCHQTDDTIIPLGPKIRNLNMNVVRDGATVNQLSHLQNLEIMQPLNPSDYSVLPNWQDPQYTLTERVRAYFDINCGHCHNHNSFAKDYNIYLDFEEPLESSRITHKRSSIVSKFKSGKMPKLGTTVVDEEALALIEAYMKSLD